MAKTPCCMRILLRAYLTLVTRQRLNQVARWALLVAVTVAVTVPLTMLGVPSAALFAALVVGIALALPSLAPERRAAPARHCRAGCARRLHRHHGSPRRGERARAGLADRGRSSRWPRCVLSIVAGALLGLHRDVSPLTGSLALVAGGASGLVAIARELGGDDRVVAVVQYLRVALVTASMPVVVTLFFHADRSHHAATSTQTAAAPWYLSVAMMTAAHLRGCRRWTAPSASRCRAARAPRADRRSTGHRPVVRPVGARRPGPGRLHGDRLAGRGRLHPGGAARRRADAARGDRSDRRARHRHRRPWRR